MAYNVSNDYRKVIYSGGAEHDAELKINNVTIPTSQISKIEFDNPMFDKEAKMFYLGQFASNQTTIYFKNMDNIPTSGKTTIRIGTKVNGTYEYVPMGTQTIDYTQDDYYKNNKLVCLDDAINMKPNIDISSFVPCTLEELLQKLCAYYNITLGTYPNTNKDYVVSTYDSTYSGKFYFSMIAELMGGNIKIGRDNKLNIIPLKHEHAVEIDATAGKEWKLENVYTISRVTYDDGKKYCTFGDDTGNTLFIRTDNIFVLDDYETLIENIYNSVVGTTIASVKTENYGDPSLDAYDIIKYKVDDKIYYTYNNAVLTYEMNIWSKLDTSIPSKVQEQTTNVIAGESTDAKIRKIQTIQNQQELSISTIVEEQKQIQKDLTASKISQGNPIEIEDAGAYPIQSLIIDGKSEQLEEPTPDNLKEIKSVKGISNLANIKDIQVGKQWNGNANINRASIIFIPAEPNTTYTLSGDITNDTNLKTLRFVETNSEKSQALAVHSTGTFITTSNTAYISIEILSDITITDDMLTGVWLLLEKGTTAKSPIPYGTWLKQMTIGKNLYNWNNLSNFSNDILTLSGTSKWGGATLDITNIIKKNPNKKICFNFDSYSETTTNKIGIIQLRIVANNKSTYYTLYYPSTDSIRGYMIPSETFNISLVELQIIYNNSNEILTNTNTLTIVKPILYFGEINEKSDYESYKEESTLIDLNIYNDNKDIIGHHELCSIGEVKDNFEDGTLTKNIKKMVLTGNEIWTSNDSAGYRRFLISLSDIYTYSDSSRHIDKILCDRFNLSTNNGYGNVLQYKNQIVFYPTDASITTIDGWKEWLSNNPTTIWYVLAELESYQVDYDPLTLFKGYNYITLNDELLPNMNIKYLTDYKINVDYATKSDLKIASDSISQNVSYEIDQLDQKVEANLELKVGVNENDKIVSMINAAADIIHLIGQRFIVESDLLKLTANDKDILEIPIQAPADYTQEDVDKAYSYVRGTGTLTDEEKIKYDITGDGNINIMDVSWMKQCITNGILHSPPGRILLKSDKLNSGIYIINSYGETISSVDIRGFRGKNGEIDEVSSSKVKITPSYENGDGLVGANDMSIIRDHGNGNVTVDATTGALFLGFEHTNGINILNGKRTYNSSGYETNAVQNEVLWESSGYYMTSTHRANLLKPVSKCPNGIVLLWEHFSNGKVDNYGYNYQYIPKYHVQSNPGGGCFIALGNVGIEAFKYVYVNNTYIAGNDKNNQTITSNGITYSNNRYVLTQVLAV